MILGIIRGALSWRGKKIYLGRKNHGARKVIRTPRLRKKNISGKIKQGKKCKKEVDPEISRGARKLAQTP